MLRAHARYSSSRRGKSEVSIKWILQLPYLKGVSTDQPPKLFAHDGQVLDALRGRIRGRVHYILIPETPVQDIKHKVIVLLGQILSLKFQVMGSQDPQSKKLVIKDQADGKSQRVLASTHQQSTFCNLIMINKICQQRHIIIDQPVEQPDGPSFQYDGAQASNP